ncbi:MAG: alpha/beta fold hydrolase [Candidatus Heimdallarchaeota archaeon]|nr:alpha/beta fold hydrolase [Candidatus Heimdallarchaeota archaeon]MCK4877882.1 alpha/beta fold hydrolase [Candidatus Heimdallarchaeota archaeon]
MQDIPLEKLPTSSKRKIDYREFPWLMLDYVEVEEGVKLRVFKIPCKNKDSKIKILVVAGLVSHFIGWIDLDKQLSEIGTVYHIESREKSSAIHSKKDADFSLETYADDIYKITQNYNFDEYYLFGDSFGSEVAVIYLDKGYPSPKGLILISPVESFAFSGWMKALFSVAPHWLYYPLLPFLLLVLKHFRTDMKNDAGTYYLNKRNMTTSKPKRMKKCALHMFNYKSEVDYSKIKCPTYIFAASTDKMHSYQQSVNIAKKIPNSTFENLVHYHKTHSRVTSNKIRDFILDVEGKKEQKN